MRRKLTWAAIGLTAVLMAGGFTGILVAQTPEETVATQTFTNVVTYTVPTVTETVTVTVPTDTGPTTTAPDPQGTRIVVRSGTWTCSQPVANYATNGLPLIVETHIPTGSDTLNGDVRLMTGCVGDPAADPDIRLEIEGGNGVGSDGDMVNLGGDPGPRDLQITGFGSCGASSASSSHPDGFQLQYGRNITVHDFELGDWETQRPGCHGAGGLWYVSGNNLQGVVCERCRMVGSTGFGAVGTGFYLGRSTNSGARDSCFSANRPFASDGLAVGGINEGNLFIDRDAGTPQPSPSDC